jgi:hypothetical protein
VGKVLKIFWTRTRRKKRWVPGNMLLFAVIKNIVENISDWRASSVSDVEIRGNHVACKWLELTANLGQESLVHARFVENFNFPGIFLHYLPTRLNRCLFSITFSFLFSNFVWLDYFPVLWQHFIDQISSRQALGYVFYCQNWLSQAQLPKKIPPVAGTPSQLTSYAVPNLLRLLASLSSTYCRLFSVTL